MDYLISALSLLGGVGLFLFGMKYLSDGLQRSAGPKLSEIMEKLTRTPWRGFLLGTLVTVIIQSSSATTVMTMGFLNAGIIALSQATGVIIGANIGTTVTSVLIALDISFIAPVCIFTGAVMTLFLRKNLYRRIGQVILGFGILFLGLETMSSSMAFFKTDPVFLRIISSVNDPVVGLLIGIVLCAILQSSSAAVGILQALALQGLIPLSASAFIICGINIGSAVPPFISAIGAKNDAKRAAWIYFIYNLAGAVIFVPLTMLVPQFIGLIENVFVTQVAQVAAYHITFKIVTALLTLPLNSLIVKLACKIVPKKAHEQFELRLAYIDPKITSVSGITAHQIRNEVDRMGKLALDNLILTCNMLTGGELSKADEVRERESLLNYLNHSITEYLVALNRNEISDELSDYIGRVFHVINDIERIGDHALNLLEKSEELKEKKYSLSASAVEEFVETSVCCQKMLEGSIKAFFDGADEETLTRLHAFEDDVDRLTKQAQDNNIKRLIHKKCGAEPGIIYVKALHDMERIGDHCDNILWAVK